jgi:hypothetical protein
MCSRKSEIHRLIPVLLTLSDPLRGGLPRMRWQSCGNEPGQTALFGHFATLFRDFDARHCEYAHLFDFKSGLLRRFTALL